jgi:hypothetical protein
MFEERDSSSCRMMNDVSEKWEGDRERWSLVSLKSQTVVYHIDTSEHNIVKHGSPV